MATVTVNSQLTLLEVAKRIAPDGKLLTIAEVLDQVNDIMKVMPWMEANGVDLHKEVRRVSEPSGTWRAYNEGAARESSTTEAVEFRLGLLEAYSTPDKELIDNDPDPQGKRMQEARAFLTGMTKTLINTIIYGNSATDSKKFTGLAPNLGTVNAVTVIDGGGTGSDVTSIYAVAPGPDSVFMVYPKGNPNIGIEHTDMGEDILTNTTANTDLVVYRDRFKVHSGLVIKDPRAIGRYANIETTGTSSIFDEDKMIELHYQMLEFNDNMFYLANRTVLTQIHKRIKDKNNVFLGIDTAFGRPVATLMGRPILLVDQISNTETAIS